MTKFRLFLRAPTAVALPIGLFVSSIVASVSWYEPPEKSGRTWPLAPSLLTEHTHPVVPAAVWAENTDERSLFPSVGRMAGGAQASGAPDSQREAVPQLAYVRFEVPPLRLVGRIGPSAQSRLLGIFSIASTGETVIAAEGHAFTGLGLVLERMEILQGSPGVSDRRGVMRTWIRDALSGRLQPLIEGEDESMGAPVAGLRVGAGQGALEVRAGETLEVSGRRWHVRAIHADPPSIEIETSDGVRLRKEPTEAARPKAPDGN